ncbi:predicted protein [Plenodomus lingam JN3]|uniref:Predicted protein n=1 Tax=Leptosphaeria maculans (strain JN3 / isolate v23.1.3 / race Av1-4-5-6-7-8) TaxID=985895 RepID=E4ZTR1_LEPMJ|nr:predicted protein [Plenodomus lingam JN3]CBX94621.1 predicted protein [Plenodomus lingam JN3]
MPSSSQASMRTTTENDTKSTTSTSTTTSAKVLLRSLLPRSKSNKTESPEQDSERKLREAEARYHALSYK